MSNNWFIVASSEAFVDVFRHLEHTFDLVRGTEEAAALCQTAYQYGLKYNYRKYNLYIYIYNFMFVIDHLDLQ